MRKESLTGAFHSQNLALIEIRLEIEQAMGLSVPSLAVDFDLPRRVDMSVHTASVE